MDIVRTTIFARSTGALPAAIAIIRISGPNAGDALATLSANALPAARHAVQRRLVDPSTGDLLDRALVLWLPGPQTVTGEDIVELHLHGGRAVVAAVERTLAGLEGLQPAAPGAFTRRAFENGRLDLSQVEGLADLLAAETERQRTQALVAAEGGLRHAVEGWQTELLQLAARAEAAIDFSDEDDVGNADVQFPGDCATLSARLTAALANPPAERLRDGVRIGIAGPPNAGKSTLLNALIGRDVAIASPVAGTTRDIVEAPVDLGGVPVVLFDTAGLRDDTHDPVEAIGVDRARAAIARSDLIVWLGPVNAAPQGDHVIAITTKLDLNPRVDGVLGVSAATGRNMELLRTLLTSRAAALLPAVGSVALSQSQRSHVQEAAASIERAATLTDEVLRAEELRAAMRALDRITGAADTEAMLDVLFGRFCIGK